MLEKKKFVNYRTDEERKGGPSYVTLKLNPSERRILDDCKKALQQEKDASAVKMLASLGAKVVLDSSQGWFFQLYLNNRRKNARLGIGDIVQK